MLLEHIYSTEPMGSKFPAWHDITSLVLQFSLPVPVQCTIQEKKERDIHHHTVYSLQTSQT
jgi:hypothetical protein